MPTFNLQVAAGKMSPAEGNNIRAAGDPLTQFNDWADMLGLFYTGAPVGDPTALFEIHHNFTNVSKSFRIQAHNAAGHAAIELENTAGTVQIYMPPATDSLRIDGGKLGIAKTPAVSLDISGTDAVQLPSGTTAERPAPAVGMIRHNTTSGLIEGYVGAGWQAFAQSPLSAGDAGAVQFSDGAGGFSADAVNFFWDDAQDRLGIGTATPDVLLHTVDGAIKFEHSSSNLLVDFESADSAILKFVNTGAGESTIFRTNRYFKFDTGDVANNALVIKASGKVGLGTASPSQLLHVQDGSTVVRTNSADAAGQYLLFEKSRNPVDGNHQVLSGNDVLGGIKFFGSDGTNFEEAAKITAQVDGTPNDDATDMPGRLSFWTTPDGTDAPVERLTIKNTGFVGVGTETPDRRLEVLDAAAAQLRLTHTDSSKFADFQVDTNHNLLITTSSNGGVRVQTTGVNKTDFFQVLDTLDEVILNVDSTNERVGIGTATPVRSLDVFNADGHPQGRFSFNAGNFLEIGVEDISGTGIIKASGGKLILDPGTTQISGNASIGTGTPYTRLTVEGAVTLKAQAAADVDTADYGQIWVKSAGDGQLWFTDDAGVDVQLGVGGGSPGGADTNIQYNNSGAFGASNKLVWSGDKLGVKSAGGATPLVSLDVEGTDAIRIPVGNNAARPTGGALAYGMVRLNTQVSNGYFLEYYTRKGHLDGNGYDDGWCPLNCANLAEIEIPDDEQNCQMLGTRWEPGADTPTLQTADLRGNDSLTAKGDFGVGTKALHSGRKLSVITACGQERTLTGTTNASLSDIVVTGIGSKFLGEVGIGSRIALSGNFSTWKTVKFITSDTSLIIDGAGLGDASSGQTMKIKNSLLRIENEAASIKMFMNPYGSLAVGPAGVTGSALTLTEDLQVLGTSSTLLSKGSTSERPGSPVTGALRFNSSSNLYEYYASSAWQSGATQAYVASVVPSSLNDLSDVSYSSGDLTITSLDTINMAGVSVTPLDIGCGASVSPGCTVLRSNFTRSGVTYIEHTITLDLATGSLGHQGTQYAAIGVGAGTSAAHLVDLKDSDLGAVKSIVILCTETVAAAAARLEIGFVLNAAVLAPNAPARSSTFTDLYNTDAGDGENSVLGDIWNSEVGGFPDASTQSAINFRETVTHSTVSSPHRYLYAVENGTNAGTWTHGIFKIIITGLA